MSGDKKITVSKTHNGGRLDLFLSAKLKLTRSQAQKLIEKKQITLNGALPKKMGSVVREGDTIAVQQSSNLPILKSSDSEKKTERLKDYKITNEPKIVATTPNYLVLNKPTGLLVHPTMANEKDTLVAWLLKKYPKIKTIGDDPKVRPGIVHRLDKEASGLMVVAKTQPMFDVLKDQFKNRTVEKEYFALVHGRVSKDWDILTFPIARSETAERMAARPVSKESSPLAAARSEVIFPAKEKSAKTEFIVEKRFVNFTLLRVIIHTGRMHQIRVHMLAYNHPLVGDPLYKQIKRKSKWDEKCGRLFLHSTKLSFIDLGGQKQTFESSLPEELEKFLKTLS